MKMFIGVVSAVAFLVVSTTSYSDECESIISLSKTISTTVQDKNSVDDNTTTFCNEYFQAKNSGKTMAATASYKFLSASFGSTQVSSEEVASKYCSASGNYSKRDDAYKQYVESISPNAYRAYEQCVAMAKRDIRFSLDAGSLLPKEFSMTVGYQPSTNASASLSFTSSEDVICNWSQGGEKIFKFSGAGSVDLTCKRDDQTKKSFVKVTRIDGNEKLTFPWPRFDKNEDPIDSLLVLQNQNNELSRKVASLENSINSSVVAFVSQACPDGWVPYENAYGRFLRGIDPNGTIDSDKKREIGSHQGDSFKAHTHTVGTSSNKNGYRNGGTQDGWHGGVSTTVSGEAGGGETRPKNVAVLFCIKK